MISIGLKNIFVKYNLKDIFWYIYSGLQNKLLLKFYENNKIWTNEFLFFVLETLFNLLNLFTKSSYKIMVAPLL